MGDSNSLVRLWSLSRVLGISLIVGLVGVWISLFQQVSRMFSFTIINEMKFRFPECSSSESHL
ncbi:uncharacterized protein BT62DRAFT_481278 [Guyanagaster necrorhizus]|uniref:Uncharacterized protein n=1 Tax=Guyanagaster necrorhizus TaxID=856835 RepID=A0A9P7VI66_9AGAR|nr:uncharacterized protein BT62DRAFT_481278 [Guyanagaster necrorhizus MCA 3950]KAG7441511.1 hypothetical protein BT62DRAFT_481278 [Guyanagaster necrorhizus MCA 3950]